MTGKQQQHYDKACAIWRVLWPHRHDDPLTRSAIREYIWELGERRRQLRWVKENL